MWHHFRIQIVNTLDSKSSQFSTTVKRARRVEVDDQPRRTAEPVRRVETQQNYRETLIAAAQAVHDARLKRITKPIQGGEGLRTTVTTPTELRALSPHIWFEKLAQGVDKKDVLADWNQAWDDLASTLGAHPKFGERREAYLTARRNTVLSLLGEPPKVKDEWRLIYRNVGTALHELVLAASQLQKCADTVQRDLRQAAENNYVDVEEILQTLRDTKTEATQSQPNVQSLPMTEIVQKQQELLVKTNKRMDEMGQTRLTTESLILTEFFHLCFCTHTINYVSCV